MTAAAAEIPRVALVGNPNCGKTALFNLLTGGHEKVGNYPGVTVEHKEGRARGLRGTEIALIDLPGTYSLEPQTLDEAVTRDALLGRIEGQPAPRVIVAVVDALSLQRSLAFVLELKRLGRPLVVAMNRMDMAAVRGLEIDLTVLSRELDVPVVPTVAVRRDGARELLARVETWVRSVGQVPVREWKSATGAEVRERFAEADRILRLAVKREAGADRWTERIDRVVLHRVLGPVAMILVLGLMFQAVFNWAALPQDWIERGFVALGESLSAFLSGAGAPAWLRSLTVDGAIAGVGGVLVFLPQILILFLFILLLEDSGYMARVAFLLDRMMSKVGLHGRAFIPLLSSFACTVPGIMATRTIANPRDRLITILISPLMACSARLSVYSLLIAAFVPNVSVFGPIRLQGLVLFGLYVMGILVGLFMAVVFRKFLVSGPQPPLLLELPSYSWPHARLVAHGLFDRAWVFLRKAGTVILGLSLLLWLLSSYPKPPEGWVAGPGESAISFSYAAKVGHFIEPVIRPLGFDWRIGLALIPAFGAREVVISALATVYAVESNVETGLAAVLAKEWSLPTAMSLLVWFVLSCQCMSTLAVTRRETHSWKWPAFMFFYMTALAHLGSLVTYQLLK